MKKFKIFNTNLKKIAVSLTIIVFSFISFGFFTDSQYFEISKNLDIFATLYRELNTFYVDETKPGDLMKKGIDAMLSSLDPYTEYYAESEIEDYKMKYVSASYGGVGAQVFLKDEKIVVNEPYEGFPMQKAGVLSGDYILEIDGKSLSGKSTEEISEMLKGQAGTKVKLLIQRDKDKPFEKQLVREEIKMKNVVYYGMLTDSVGYIKLDKFLENSAKEVKDAFTSLKTNPKLKSLVFDLRGNGGGILQESVEIVNVFVNRGQKIVTQKARIQEMNREHATLNAPIDADIPLAILIDGGSASASEITAGAIQDLDRGVVIGERSFGKGLVQQTKPLSYNSQLKLTVAKYFTPSGRCVQALNYSTKAANGKVNHVPDSLIAEFKTKNGRSVYDGSGVYPDLLIDHKRFSNISIALVTKQIVFDYATNYRITHASIADAKKFSLTDAEYNDFLEFIKDKDYGYSTESEKALEKLKESAVKEKYFDALKEEYDALKTKMIHDKKADLIEFKDEIKLLLEEEIVSRYYFQSGRLENSLVHDNDVKEALKVLGNPKLYATILNGEGEYKIIGKPKSGTHTKNHSEDDEDKN